LTEAVTPLKSILAIGMITFALSFCGFLNKNSNDNGNSNNKNSSSPTSSSGSDIKVERPEPTAAQTASVANGASAKWDQQGITWTLPLKWKSMDVKKEAFNYMSGDGAFLLVNISPMSDDFPVEASINAYYKSKGDEMKNGKIEEFKMLELDGVKGVQWRESMPEDKSGPRRLQWIAYRKYGGQVQMVNVMLSTDGSKFADHQDEFYGILYSTKLVHD
jgi:hypothetical protein